MPSISICHPMTGAVVEVNFTVCGTCAPTKDEKDKMTPKELAEWYKRATVNVLVSNGMSMQPLTCVPDAMGNWTAPTNIGSGNDYTVLAVLNQGTAGEASDTCDDIDVVMAGMAPVTIGGNPCAMTAGPMPVMTGEVRALGMFLDPPVVECHVHKVRSSPKDPKKTQHTHSAPGKPVRQQKADVKGNGKNWTWTAKNLKVDKKEVCQVVVLVSEEVTAMATSGVPR